METVQLSNGTVIDNAHCLEVNNRLFVYISSSDDIKRWFDLFVEPENTQTIESDYYGDKNTYSGYTDLFSISKENGNINIVLAKGES